MALAYRAYFTFIARPRLSSRGLNTSAAYGFTTALLKLITDVGLDHAAVVFDAEGPTFRHDLYEAYKGTREPPPADLLTNLPYIRAIAEALSLAVYEVPHVEADDVIGTLARRAAADGAQAVIVSPDKDFQQLLSPAVSLFKPARRGEEFDLITEASFRSDYGIEPVQFIDVLALMGDTADNVPGVRGIGEKTALSLIQRYGTLDNLLAHAEEVSGKRAREGLLEHGDLARLSKTLVTLRTDLDVPLDWDALARAPLSVEAVAPLFRELEFRTLLRRLQGDTPPAAATPPPPAPDAFPGRSTEELRRLDEAATDFRLITSRAELVALEKTLRTAPALALYSVDTGGAPVWADWVGLSVAWAADAACYVPIPLPDGTGRAEILRLLAPVFANANIRKIGHNIKPLLLFCAQGGVDVRGALFDTEVAHYLLSPETNHDLDFAARAHLGYAALSLDALRGTGRQSRALRELAPREVTAPACEAASLAYLLAPALESLLNQRQTNNVATQMEFPLIYVLTQMEAAGVKVDRRRLTEIGSRLKQEIADLERQIFEAAGRVFQVGSTKQLGEVLFSELGLPSSRKTATGQPSTREDVLAELATEHPLPGLVIDWRKASKLSSTYIRALKQHIHPETGRVHTVFNQTVAATGRLSSSEPGLQNIPVRQATGREIRRAFVAPEGHVILAADYAQIELRILAHMSGDAALLEAFRSGRDIHAETAARVLHSAADAVTREERNKAKAVNYGIPYGLSAFGLAQQLRCPLAEARQFIDEYYAAFPGVAPCLGELVERARERGYAQTLWGRRRYLPALEAPTQAERAAAERIAINMPIQGTQADMIKLAMVGIHGRFRHEGFASRLLLQVHDELVFEVPHFEVADVVPLIEAEMVSALPLSVPVQVDISYGETWLDAH